MDSFLKTNATYKLKNCSSIRYGPGVTEEVGMDFENMGAKKVAVITDKNLVRSLKERLNTLPLVDRLINELRGNLLI